jgi:hypothetical protein
LGIIFGADQVKSEQFSTVAPVTGGASGAPARGEPRVFVSFDVEHDRELYELLLAQSEAPGSGFSVSDASETAAASGAGSELLRLRIHEVDQVIVICGEHTGSSIEACAELRIAKAESIPYFLLWGRPKIMCTKPVGAKGDEGMYSWTPQILQDQIAVTARRGSKPPA